MTTYNNEMDSQHVAAYLADVTAGLGNKKRATGLLDALRGHADWVRIPSWAWLRSGNGLEADTRQIRNYGRSRAPGACEVRIGLRLAI
jgi:hypothetical protein